MAVCDGEVDNSGLCPSCWSELTLISTPSCAQCDVPFNHDITAAKTSLRRCGDCLRDPPNFDQTHAAIVYPAQSRHLLLALKHGDRQDVTPVLAEMMGAECLPLIAAADWVLPLPLHPSRFFARRFNQSAEISRYLLRHAPTHQHKFTIKILIRRRKTAPTGHKSRSQRDIAMKGAFSVPKPQRQYVKDKHILIVDDVMTTGASLSSAVLALKCGEAKTVSVGVVAKVC